MEGHQRNLYLYDRFNARVVGVSRDDVITLKYWGNDLGVTFPLLSNITAFLGVYFDAQPEGKPIFGRRTVIIDKKGIIRYVRDGSPDFKDILLFLKKLNQEGGK
jgi:peroxiredoxin